jgi:hypothetical protein
MRKAAGILLIIFGVGTIGISILDWVKFNLLRPEPSSGIHPDPLPGLVLGMEYGPFYPSLIIPIILAVFFIIGGVFCLKRKYWALCFTSSLFLHFWMIAALLGDFFYYFWWYGFLFPVGILPFIFICLRRREWQAQEFQG